MVVKIASWACACEICSEQSESEFPCRHRSRCSPAQSGKIRLWKTQNAEPSGQAAGAVWNWYEEGSHPEWVALRVGAVS